MTQMKVTRALVAAFVLLGGAVFAFANMEPDDTRIMQYSGTLQSDGSAVTGPHDFRVGLFTTNTVANAADCLLTDPPGCALWSSELADVPVYAGAFSLTLGEADALSDAVLGSSALYLAMAVRASGDTDFSLLSGYQRIVPSPLASRAAGAKDFKVTGNLTANAADLGATVVDSLVTTGTVTAARVASSRIVPDYASWSSGDVGAGGAAIVNDDGNFQSLLIVGNDSAGGDRNVRIFDHLNVAGNLTAGQLRGGSLRHGSCLWRNASPYNLNNNQDHSVTCSSGEFMAGWKCYASDRLDGNCQAYCCTP